MRRLTAGAAWVAMLVFGATRPAVAAGQAAAPSRGDTSAVAAPAAPSQPRDSALEARTSAVASQLRCPVCQGLSIQDSPSELAQSMRSVVRDQLAAGRTPDEVKAYYVSKYGEWILLAPEASGFNLVAYLVPVVVVVGGILLIVVAVRRWTRGSGAAAT
ncbi:MAG TPA: cytochrome c-type biogenesis protein CcmH [Gemmatimonadaceae bacterium]|nr:cytochrome c-type biogenesis protein CcmH [Gemmatimonadaceae bacterium]